MSDALLSDADVGLGPAPAPPGSSPPLLSDADVGLAPAAGSPKGTLGSAVSYGIANAVPFAHDIGAAIQAGETYLPKSLQVDDTGSVAPEATFSQRMAQQKARIDAQDVANQRDYPITSFVAPLATSIAALPMAGPVDALSAGVGRVAPRLAGLAADTIGAGAVGAGYGALYGAGTGDSLDQRLANAKAGAVFGGVGGAAGPTLARGVGHIANAAMIPFTSPEALATRKFAESLTQDRALGSSALSPTDYAAAQAAGQPAVAADLGGQATRRLARTAANASPEADAALSGVVNDRYEDQGPRVAGFLQNLFGNNLDAQGARDALAAKARAVNAPAYARAYADGANGVWTPELQTLTGAPAVQSAIQNATKIAANDAALRGTAAVRNPFVADASGALGLKTNPDGSQAIPTLQFWDYVKRGLDDQIGAAFRGGEKGAGSQILGLKNQLLSHLDNAVPAYAAARQGAFRMFGADNALEAGENFLKMAPAAQTGQMRAALSAMTPAQKQIFAQGLASQMAQSAVNAPVRRNVIGMFNSPEIAERLQMGLGPQIAPQVEAFLRRESAMDMLRTAVSGNSTTARQASDMEQAGHGIVGMMGSAISSPLAGAIAGGVAAYHEAGLDPTSIAEASAGGALAGLMGKYVKGVNARIMHSLGEQLASPDPTKVNAAVQRIGANPKMLDALRAAEKSLTYLSASKGGSLAPAQNQPQIQAPIQSPQLAPAFKSGGRVEVDANPTEKQKMVGNYKKHHIRIHGLDVSIENPKGSFRSGSGSDGKPWRVRLPHHYGYIRGTMGSDGDHIDCYVGPNETSDKVFVVDQKDLKTGKFDEHKAMLGFKNREAAIGGYCNGFSDGKGCKRLMKITPMSVAEFKAWLDSGKTREPIGKAA